MSKLGREHVIWAGLVPEDVALEQVEWEWARTVYRARKAGAEMAGIMDRLVQAGNLDALAVFRVTRMSFDPSHLDDAPVVKWLRDGRDAEKLLSMRSPEEIFAARKIKEQLWNSNSLGNIAIGSPRGLLQTMAGRAAAVQAWLEGETQARIASTFGLSSPSSVNASIRAFILHFYPEWSSYGVYEDKRRAMAAAALTKYLVETIGCGAITKTC